MGAELLIKSAIAVGGIGLFCAFALALAAKFLAVQEDPKIEEIIEILPSANCGGCGFAGCADYAKAVVLSNASINLCAPGGADVLNKLASCMGVTAEAAEKRTAIVLCAGDQEKAPRRFVYNGVADCWAANSIGGGDKACGYGCLGYGSCMRVCPEGAIELRAGLAVVHPQLCISCGACVKACPRNLIKMIPVSRVIHVLCSSSAKGPVVKKACQVGCIGCTKCTKVAPEGAIVMNGPLAIVDYTKDMDSDEIVESCPMKCIVKGVA